MRTSRRTRQALATALLVVYLPACYRWPTAYLAPAELEAKRAVRVTDLTGEHLWIDRPQVRGDSLVGRRWDADYYSVREDTVGLPLVAVAYVRVGSYRNVLDPVQGVAGALPGTKRVRVMTATDTLQLERPWVRGYYLFGYRVPEVAGSTEPTPLQLRTVYRLDVRKFDPRWVLGGIGLAGLAALLIYCAADECVYSR